jgi:hypothetical protein
LKQVSTAYVVSFNEPFATIVAPPEIATLFVLVQFE